MWLSKPVAKPPPHWRKTASRHSFLPPSHRPPIAPGSGLSASTTEPGRGPLSVKSASVCCVEASSRAYKSGSVSAPENRCSPVRRRPAEGAFLILRRQATRCSTTPPGPTGCVRPENLHPRPRKTKPASSESRASCRLPNSPAVPEARVATAQGPRARTGTAEICRSRRGVKFRPRLRRSTL